ncbi:hypothetical protein G3M54_01375 [Bacillus megaterium NBRC 15308 = ATCC 14581]|nr:hypothetical protein [Priestia megaterium NBRC 15308 = ATCC 14581]
MDLTPEEHVEVQAVAQQYVCSSISKTVNAPKGYTLEQVKKAYEYGFKLGLKGMTIYVDGSRYEQILSLGDEEEGAEEEVKKKLRSLKESMITGNVAIVALRISTLVEGCPQCDDCGSQSCSI